MDTSDLRTFGDQASYGSRVGTPSPRDMPLRRSTEVTPTAGDGDEPESTAPREQRADLQTPGSSSEHPERLRQFAFFRLSSEEYISDPYERGRIA